MRKSHIEIGTRNRKEVEKSAERTKGTDRARGERGSAEKVTL